MSLSEFADTERDLHYKMSKKIAQLVKVIYTLNCKVEDNDALISATRKNYENRLLQFRNDANQKVTELQGVFQTRLSGTIPLQRFEDFKISVRKRFNEEKELIVQSANEITQRQGLICEEVENRGKLIAEKMRFTENHVMNTIKELKGHYRNSLDAVQKELHNAKSDFIKIEEQNKKINSDYLSLSEKHKDELELLERKLKSEKDDQSSSLKLQFSRENDLAKEKMELAVQQLEEKQGFLQSSLEESHEFQNKLELSMKSLHAELDSIKEENKLLIQKCGTFESELAREKTHSESLKLKLSETEKNIELLTQELVNSNENYQKDLDKLKNGSQSITEQFHQRDLFYRQELASKTKEYTHQLNIWHCRINRFLPLFRESLKAISKISKEFASSRSDYMELITNCQSLILERQESFMANHARLVKNSISEEKETLISRLEGEMQSKLLKQDKEHKKEIDHLREHFDLLLLSENSSLSSQIIELKKELDLVHANKDEYIKEYEEKQLEWEKDKKSLLHQFETEISNLKSESESRIEKMAKSLNDEKEKWSLREKQLETDIRILNSNQVTMTNAESRLQEKFAEDLKKMQSSFTTDLASKITDASDKQKKHLSHLQTTLEAFLDVNGEIQFQYLKKKESIFLADVGQYIQNLLKSCDNTALNLRKSLSDLEQAHQHKIIVLNDELQKQLMEISLTKQTMTTSIIDIRSRHARELDTSLSNLRQEHEIAIKKLIGKIEDLDEMALKQSRLHTEELAQERLRMEKSSREMCNELDRRWRSDRLKEKSQLEEEHQEILRRLHNEFSMKSNDLEKQLMQRGREIIELKENLQYSQNQLDQALRELQNEKTTRIDDCQRLEKRLDEEVRMHKEAQDQLQANNELKLQRVQGEFNDIKWQFETRERDLTSQLVNLEHRYAYRESREEDVNKINSLLKELDEVKLDLSKNLKEKKTLQLELVNREENYNKVFGRSPIVADKKEFSAFYHSKVI